MIKICLFFFMLVVNLAYTQFNKFGFDACLTESGDQMMPFAILNDAHSTVDKIKKTGMIIKKVTPNYIYVTSTPKTIADLYRAKQIKDFYYTFTKPVLLNDSTRVHHKVNQVHNGTNGLDASYTGKNVIIGYVDTGCDFQHPDFKDAAGNSRIIRYWDHNLPVDAMRTPSAYGYGQIFDSIDLNNMLPIPDCSSGHGTTVTGAGSGNGLANGKNAGMAPDSKIIIVDFNFSMNNWTLAVSDAVDYIFSVADQYNLPAVVNISLGQYFGSHDGNDPATELIEELLEEKPGRIVVSSAGNGGNFKNYHIQSVVDNTPSFVWLKNTPSGAFGTNTAFFDLWGSAGQVEGINFSFSAVNPATNFQTRGTTATYNVLSTIESTIIESIRNANGDTIAKLEIYTGIQSGAYNMFALLTRIDSTDYYISFNTSGTGKFDAWTGANFNGYEFVQTLPLATDFPEIVNYIMPDSLQSIVSDWNCSEKVMSVGNMQNRTSYTDINGVLHDDSATLPPTGKLAPSSSIGPSRLGIMKPEVTVAGDGTFSPVPICFLENPGLQFRVLEDGWHAPNGGTSMASPALAGIAGLYLEKCPKATYQDFKNGLMTSSYSDAFTGTTPNFAYGYGKADALALLLNPTTEMSLSISKDVNNSCLGDLITFTASLTNGGNNVVYNWFHNNQLVSSNTTYSSTNFQNGDFVFCVVKSTNLCVANSEVMSNIIVVSIIENAVIDYEGSFSLKCFTSAVSYQWYDCSSNQPIEGATNSSYSPTKAGSYYVVAGLANCNVSSTCLVVGTSGIDDHETTGIFCYPNPTNGNLHITNTKSNAYEIRVKNLSGQLIKRQVATHQDSELDLVNQADGLYFIEIVNESLFTEIVKIIKK